MNTQEQQLEQVEIDIERAKGLVDLAEALQRLHLNKDFEKIIVDGYFKEEASRSVLLKADPEMQEDVDQKHIDVIITGIGALFAYFNKIYVMGNAAARSLEEDVNTHGEILAEQLGEENL